MSEKETVQTHNVIQILEGGPVVLFFCLGVTSGLVEGLEVFQV